MTSPLNTNHNDAMVDFIIHIAPKHNVWCEPFFCEGEVFFKKKPSQKEIVNDPDNRIINFYHMIRSRWEQLSFLMQSTLHADFIVSLAERVAKDDTEDQLRKAWSFWLLYNKAFVSPERWSVSELLPTERPDYTDGHYSQVMKALSDRLSNTLLTNRDPYRIIHEADGEDTLFFISPKNRKELILIEPYLQDIKGKFILHSREQKLLHRIAERLGLYTDNDCKQFNIYLNYVRQHTLFD